MPASLSASCKKRLARAVSGHVSRANIPIAETLMTAMKKTNVDNKT